MCGAMVPGTVVFAAAYGTLAAQKGLSLTEAVLMSALVFGGASQLVALEVWTHPLTAWTVVSLAVVTAIIIQAVSRFANPIVVHGKAVTVAASLGLLLDQFVARMLSHVRRDLNVRELEAETIKQSSLRAWKVIHLKLKRR